jgi:osmotically-inducible protein OsmY
MTTRNILAALALATMVSACGNTADGMKKDADNAGEKTAEAAADAGSAMGGAAKTGEVKTALMADARVNAGDINVDTDEAAKTVTLKGTVKADSEKTIAGEIAAAKATGYSIVNSLTIKP